jgi:L-asparagine transporter-like permease
MAKKIPIRKFSVRLIVFSAIIAALSVIMQLALPQYSTPALPFIVLFFFVITLFTLYIVLRDDVGKNERRFVSSYMLSRIIKFFSCILFLVLYLMLCPEKDRIRFVAAFLIIYFLYSVFEVFILKKENEHQHSSEENIKQA